MPGMSLGGMGEHGRYYASMNARDAQSASSWRPLRREDFNLRPHGQNKNRPYAR
jgi:hypothetical protein